MNTQIISISKILFFSEENFYCVFEGIDNNIKKIYLGFVYYPFVNMNLRISTENIISTYGSQEKIIYLEYLTINNVEAFKNFLQTSYFPKIGKKISNKFCLDFNIRNALDLQNIHKINTSNKSYQTIINNYIKYEEFLYIYKNFYLLGFNQEQILECQKKFGNESIQYLNNNIYFFYKKISKLSFGILDKIGLKKGFNNFSIERLKAGTIACIEEYQEKTKNSFIEYNELVKLAIDFLNIPEDIYFISLSHLIEDKKISELIVENNNLSYNYISQPTVYNIEKSIFNNLCKINLINKYKLNNSDLPFFLSNTQKNGILNLFNNQLSFITGMPGTGKTTIIQYGIELFLKNNIGTKIKIGTPTGKAAKRVKESISSEYLTQSEFNIEISTNHRLLKYLPHNQSFFYNEDNKLDIDLLILDESSMLDIYMFYQILKSLPSTCYLWIIGDINQLPSIQLGNILEDCITSKKFNHIHLNEVFRQNENSLILKNAQLLLNNEDLIIPQNEYNQDFYFFNILKDKDTSKKTIDLFFQISQFKKYSLEDIQILSPQKSGFCGTDYLNYNIQKIIHTNTKNKSIKWKDKEFFIGDKVIQTVNDYDRNIFNGDIFYIEKFEDFKIYLKNSDGSFIAEKQEIDELELAYALTVHKYQGSEVKSVILPISDSFYHLNKSIIYTGMTRAKDLMTFVGNLSYFNKTKNKEIEKRNTFLNQFLNAN